MLVLLQIGKANVQQLFFVGVKLLHFLFHFPQDVAAFGLGGYINFGQFDMALFQIIRDSINIRGIDQPQSLLIPFVSQSFQCFVEQTHIAQLLAGVSDEIEPDYAHCPAPAAVQLDHCELLLISQKL